MVAAKDGGGGCCLAHVVGRRGDLYSRLVHNFPISDLEFSSADPEELTFSSM